MSYISQSKICFPGGCCPSLVTDKYSLLPFQVISEGDYIRSEISVYGSGVWTEITLPVTSVVTEGFYIHSYDGSTIAELDCGAYEFRVIAGETWWFEPFTVEEFDFTENAYKLRDLLMTPLKFSEQLVSCGSIVAPCDSFLPFMYTTENATTAPTYTLVSLDGTETALTITVDVLTIDGRTYYIHDGECFYPFLECGRYYIRIDDGAYVYFSAWFDAVCGINDIPDGYRAMRDANGCVMRDDEGEILTEECSEIPEPFTFTLESVGTGLGVSTLKMEVTEDTILTMDGTARFYSNSLGTLGESDTWNITSGALRTIYIRCPSGTSTMTINNRDALIGIGDNSAYGWLSPSNSARLVFSTTELTLLQSLTSNGLITVTGDLPTGLIDLWLSNTPTWTYSQSLPSGLQTLQLGGANLSWTYNGAVPSGLTTLLFNGNSINWTYAGALPVNLTRLQLAGTAINWTYNGALPVNLTYLVFDGALIAWTYNGAVPSGLTTLSLSGNSINWSYNGALPTGLTYFVISSTLISWTYNSALPTGLTILSINGASLDWTGLDIGDLGNIVSFTLFNYRQAKMSSADMITLLTQLTNRTGTLPATITIRDYVDYASPPAGVVTAVDTLKATKGITTVTFGA